MQHVSRVAARPLRHMTAELLLVICLTVLTHVVHLLPKTRQSSQQQPGKEVLGYNFGFSDQALNLTVHGPVLLA